jgi:hypothetical protein
VPVRLSRTTLTLAFAFTVMADPVSSVAYAIEAALRSLHGDLSSLVPTMAAVIAIIAVISATYHELIGRFPSGGGGPEGIAHAFGEGWAFIPLGALLVDFTLTAGVSCAAGASALIAYKSELEPIRTRIGLGLVVLVAGNVLLGQGGRVVFAIATIAFIALSICVIVSGVISSPGSAAAGPCDGWRNTAAGHHRAWPSAARIPLGMALATGVEAPSNAIAQLPQLDDRARRRLGRLTLWLMVGIVGTLTIAFTVLAVYLGTDLPPANSTLIAEVARHATGGGPLFVAFQASSALLLMSAAASSYLAGSGVLKALAMIGRDGEGLVPSRFGRINRFLIPEWGASHRCWAPRRYWSRPASVNSASSDSTRWPSSQASWPRPSPAPVFPIATAGMWPSCSTLSGGPGGDNPRYQRDSPRRLDRLAGLCWRSGVFVANLVPARPSRGVAVAGAQ